MSRVLLITVVSLAMPIAAGHASVVDEFSEGGWTRSTSTPGRVSVDTGKLHLEDGRESPSWISVNKTFSIDAFACNTDSHNIDATSLHIVQIKEINLI